MFQLFVKSLFQQKVLDTDPLLDFAYIRYLLDDQKFHWAENPFSSSFIKENNVQKLEKIFFY